MPKFICTYHGGKKPETAEEKQAGMEKWLAWTESISSSLINPGNPVGITKVLTKYGVANAPSPHPLMGFSIIEAENIDNALELLKDCPHIHIFEGTLEVSEIMEIPSK